MKLKAIDTEYKGYLFRSRLEARWAVFFDALGIKWEYEKEGYDLGELGWYLPDFYLTNLVGDIWFGEVKGDMNDEIGLSKARYLDDHTPEPAMGLLVFTGLNYAFYTGDIQDHESLSWNREVILAMRLGVSIERFNWAIDKARQARFEHKKTIFNQINLINQAKEMFGSDLIIG
jgi:hypothetical protein